MGMEEHHFAWIVQFIYFLHNLAKRAISSDEHEESKVVPVGKSTCDESLPSDFWFERDKICLISIQRPAVF